MSDFVLDASLAMPWFLEDETDRKYSLAVLASMAENRALVPVLWFYEIGNALVMACRRKRISLQQAGHFLERLESPPIYSVEQTVSELFALPRFAHLHSLTNYDAAYLTLALKLRLPLATSDKRLREATVSAGVGLATV